MRDYGINPKINYYGTKEEQNLMEAVRNKTKLRIPMEKQ